MGIGQRQTTFPVETKSIKIPNHIYMKIMVIQLVFEKTKVLSSDFRFCVTGKVMISNEQVKTIESGHFNLYTFITRF
jgi:hypothetical protein